MRSVGASALWLLIAASASFHYDPIRRTVKAAPPDSDQPCRNQSCGTITNINYPFTLTINNASCPAFNSLFQLYCDETTQTLFMLHDVAYNGSLIPSLPLTAILNDSLIVNFSDLAAVMKPFGGNVYNCTASSSVDVLLPPAGMGPYVVSDENEFGSFGCSKGTLETSDVKFLKKSNGEDSTNLSRAHRSEDKCSVALPDVGDDGEGSSEKCGGETCCLDSLPPTSDHATRYVAVDVTYTDNDYNQTDPVCRCANNYATIFHRNYSVFGGADKKYGVKINWALPSELFDDNARLAADPNYACASNANSVPVTEIKGYLCSCNRGYAGDGYANGSGCSDVNECLDPSLHRCVRESQCKNSEGSYTCDCNSQYDVGDGREDGTRCKLSPSILTIIATFSSIFGLLLMVGIITLSITLWSKRVKQRNFMLNGGLELQEFMKNVGQNIPRIFTEVELKVATHNYADDMKIGVGGFGAVYKGKLQDGKIVAIKKSNKLENGGNAQFLNEISILTKINHKHIVKLLGCCLETKTPLLVYEFVPNGTLVENLERKDGSFMTWQQRLIVAIQTSEALAYLHRAASPPILHRDVKSTNVLLDENWNVKVVDFGVSRLVPDGIDHVSTAIKGTLGYLDPEYFQTLQLTDKSDVYSFEVLLVELITTLKPVDFLHRQPQFSNLALLFIQHIKEGRVERIIDPRLEMVSCDQVTQHDVDWAWKIRSSILSVASLAHRCLALMGHDRPSMIEVEHELHRIAQSLRATNIDNVQERSSYEVGVVTMENDQYDIQSIVSNVYSSTHVEQCNEFQLTTLGR